MDSGGALGDGAIGPGGNLYATDLTNQAVQIFSATDGSYPGHYGNTGIDGNVGTPIGLAFAPDGDLNVVAGGGRAPGTDS